MRDGCAEESINLFMEVLQEKDRVIKKNDLFYGIPKFRITNDPDQSTTTRVQFFDSILHECLQICKDNVPTMAEDRQTEIWFSVITTLFTMRNKIIDKLKSEDERSN